MDFFFFFFRREEVRLCVVFFFFLAKNRFYSFRTVLLQETRLQIIPMMNVKFNKSGPR